MDIRDPEMPDGIYISHPTHGPKTAVRKTEIRNGLVVMGEHSFVQWDFFKVNTLVKQAAAVA